MTVTLRSLVKAYGPLRALDEVSLDLVSGTVTALVGANGGGKSTLLRILAGVLAADGGTIEGLDRPRVAFMPDRLAFSRGWTPRSWLTLVARWKRVPRGRVDAVLDEMQLTGWASQPVAALSQGMVRRLLYAQTRLADDDLILLDEPEGGLDPHWTVRLEGEVDRLRAEGRTLVFSTHWLDLAVDRADTLVVFNRGRVICDPAESWRPLDSRARRLKLASLIEAQG